MVRQINNRLFKINTYASERIVEVDDNYDDEVQNLRKELQLDSLGYKLNLLVYLAGLTVQGYVISSVTEFNSNGTRPRVAYANDKDFKKIVKYYFEKIGKKPQAGKDIYMPPTNSERDTDSSEDEYGFSDYWEEN